MKKQIFYIILILTCSLAFVSCEEEEVEPTYTEEGNPNGTGQRYVFSFWTNDYTQYISTFNSIDDLMNGEINMKGKGIEQSGNMIPVGNKFFACSTDEDGGRSYYIDVNGNLATGGRKDRIYVETAYAYGNTDDNKSVIVGASWQGSTTTNEILVYDPQTVSYTSRKIHDFGMSMDNVTYAQWPTDVLASGDYVYISYYPKPMESGWKIPAGDTAYVKVLKYPSLEYVKDIKNTRTTAIGLYYANTSLIIDEEGDIYSFSSNAYTTGYVPNANKPSAIMRIKKGDTDFDKDYFINVEESIIQGKVISAYHAEKDIVVVIYIPKELDTPENDWAFIGGEKRIFKSAVIHLKDKKIIPVTGLPDHIGDNFYGYKSLYAENGKAYKSYLTANDARIYEIDLYTGEAKAGARIVGGHFIPVIDKLKY